MPSRTRQRPTLGDFEVAVAAVPPVDDRPAHQVAVDAIRPSAHNPRRTLERIDELASSLQEYGLLQPVVVRHVQAGYELIAGHRRLAAAQQLGWAAIAAVVRDETDDQAYVLTLTENLQREDLKPKEEAAALEVLVRERGWTTRQVGDAIKRSPMYVSRRLRVFEDDVLAPLVLRNDLPVSTAEELLRVPHIEDRRALAHQAVAERWERPQVRAALDERCNAALQRGLPPRLTSRAVVRQVQALRRLLHAGSLGELSGEAADALRALARELNDQLPGLP